MLAAGGAVVALSFVLYVYAFLSGGINDGAARYASKMFNVEFLKERGLPHPPWLVDGEDDVDAAARSVMVEEE